MPLTESLRLKVLWLFLAVSCLAAIEPSPYEAMFFVAIFAFARGGLAFEAGLAPLIVCLLAFDAAALVALIPWVEDSQAVSFTGITIYISLTTILFAGVVADNALERMKTIRSGYGFAAMLAALLGIAGYFNIAGLGPLFTLYDNTRASGPFKDPNVFGPFMAAPMAWICQDLLLRRASAAWSALKLLVMMTAVLLSFSRGATIDALFTLVLVLGLTYLTAAAAPLRRRVAMTTLLCVGAAALLVALAMAIPSIRDLALERATLTEDYDAGEQGRFGNQLRSIPLLLELPLGFGPYRFIKYFPIDPHEVFLSAFASFGWMGGIAFATFIAMTLYVGWAFVFRRSRQQTELIGVWAALLPQILQGVQIDTMHWRHMFLLIGCLFGLAASAQRESAASAPAAPDGAVGARA
jgi:hypothetical protein